VGLRERNFLKEDISVSMEFGVGSIVMGRVSGITKFGAFIALPEGRSGLCHISEISYTYVNDVKDLLKEGQEVQVKVIGIDENGRINLSIKKTQEPPPRPEGGPRPGRPGGGRPPMNPGRPAGGPRSAGGPRPAGGFDRSRKSPEPSSFEDKLKQFMASSDSKLSELHMNEKRGNRRSGGGGGRR
jgi:S1 RNA binding domain protein